MDILSGGGGLGLGSDEVFADFLVLFEQHKALAAAFFLGFSLGDFEAELQ